MPDVTTSDAGATAGTETPLGSAWPAPPLEPPAGSRLEPPVGAPLDTPAGPPLEPPPPAPVPTSHDAQPRAIGLRHLVATGVIAAMLGGAVAVPLSQEAARDAVADLGDGPAGQQASADLGSSGDTSPPTIFAPGASLTAAIATQVLPSVVRVDQRSPGGGGTGSGVIWSSDGYILTNAHVVDGATEVRVSLPDGTEHTATVIGADATSDVAVLKIEATDLPVPAFADDLPAIGETALAIGSPYGLDGSVTAGIVSSLNRRVTTSGAPLVDLIQTDAAINAGNSGGALVNGAGEVMGINTAILSRSGGNDGIGFAIPISTAGRVAEQLIDSGEVRHAYLGISGQSVDPEIASLYGLATSSGVLIQEVAPDEAAAASGLRSGDIIVGMAGYEVTSMADLLAVIGRLSPGEQVEVVWLRSGAEQRATVTLGETTR